MITSLFGYFAASLEDKIQTVVGNNTSSSDSGCLFSSVLNSAGPMWVCMSPVALLWAGTYPIHNKTPS